MMKVRALVPLIGLLGGSSNLSANKAEMQSYLFVRIKDQVTLAEKNAQKLLSPASVTKLITAIKALKKWGPDSTIKTPIGYTGQFSAGVIRGDLIMKGQGDPYLTNEKLWPLIKDLKHLGLTEVKGNILIDNDFFKGAYHDSSRIKSQTSSQHAYDAPIAALSLNFNNLSLAVAARKNNSKPYAALDPYDIEYVDLQNNAIQKTSTTKSQLNLSRESLPSSPKLKLTLNGELGNQAELKKLYRSISDPVIYAGSVLKAFLASEGIKVEGTVKEGSYTAEAKLLSNCQGFDLAYIIKGLNIYSNNFIADMLTSKLGAEADPKDASSLNRGAQVLSDFLRTEVGIKDNFIIKNGSGLSTENRLSPRQLVDLLVFAEKHFDIFPEFLNSLPKFGIEGSLKHRFTRDETFRRSIRAKTGTLSEPFSVSSLSGYMDHPQHGLIAFAIMANGEPKNAQSPTVSDLKEAEDKTLIEIWSKLNEKSSHKNPRSTKAAKL